MPFHLFKQSPKEYPPKLSLIKLIAFSVVTLVLLKACFDEGTNNTSNIPEQAKSEPAAPIDPTEGAIRISAPELVAVYHENEVSADNRFQGNKVLVVGEVNSISKNFADDIYIVLSAGNSFNTVHCGGVSNEVAANLYKGQLVAFLGSCKGMLIGSVFIENCQLIESK